MTTILIKPQIDESLRAARQATRNAYNACLRFQCERTLMLRANLIIGRSVDEAFRLFDAGLAELITRWRESTDHYRSLLAQALRYRLPDGTFYRPPYG